MREDESERRRDEHNNAIGYLAVAVIALFCGFMLGGEFAPPIFAISFDSVTLIGKKAWIDEYQTLVGSVIGAFVAIGAAITAWAAVQKQIQLEYSLEQARRERKARAVRSVMPLSLSGICDYACKASKALRDTAQSDNNERRILLDTISISSYDHFIIRNLSECIEYIDESSTKQLDEIISWIQVVNSRLNPDTGLNVISRTRHDSSNIIDCAKLYEMASAAFEFARGESSTIKFELEISDITRALHVMGFREQAFPQLYEMVCRRFSIGDE